MATDNKRKLYDALSQDYDMGSYEQFCADLNDEAKRRKLYDATSQDYDLGTWDSFSQQLGYGQTAATPAPAPERPAAPVDTLAAPTPPPASPKDTQYFKLRRGGKDFTVSTDEVNAAGGLTGWAKANPGAPLRVYMQGTNEDGKPFDGHVDLSVAHDRSKRRGYKYTTTSTAIEDKPWQPTEQQKISMSRQLHQMQEQTDAMFAESRERMENVSEYYRGNRGLGFHTVEGKPVFNPETGKMEKTYLTPTGDRTTSKTAADMSTYNFRQAMAAADMSVGAQIRRAEAELAELRKQLTESSERVYQEWAEDYEKNDAPLAAVLAANTYVPRQTADKENSALRVAIRQREEQLKNLYEERDRQIGKDVGFWRGFGRTVSDVRTWDFGTGDLLDAMTMLHADQYSAPDATEGEKRAGKAMMSAVYDAQQTEQMFGENASFWNRAGVMTGYMPSFMVDFALTGGGFEVIDVAGKAATRGAVKVIGKEAIEEMVELGVKEYAKKYGVRGVGRMAGNWSIKALGTTADDLLIRAPLMTNTVQAGKTTADIIDRKLGDVVVDENGNYDFSNDKTWGSAIWQGEANAIIENYSEMFGTHLDGVVPALAKTFGGKRISGMLARANASSYGQILATTRKQFERLGVSDYFGEVSEEYYGQLWRTMLNLDDAYTNVPVYDEQGNQVLDADGNPVYERKNLLFTGQFHGDIWGGMALSMGLMGAGKYAVSGIAYGNMKHQVNVADRVAAEIFTPDRWEPIREIIDNTTNDDIGALAENMVNDPNLSDEERAAVMGYMERSLNLRGLNLGAMAQSRGTAGWDEALPVNIEVDSELSQSYIDGYEASSPQEMNDAQNMYEYQRQRAESIFEPTILDWLDTNPVNALVDMSQNGLYSQEEIEAARDYINAKTVRDGIIQRVNDNIDEQIARSDALIAERINRQSGMIQPAIMGLDDRQVFVVDGTVAINEDGTVDRGGSDESIIVRDAQTGKLEFTSPKSIVSVGEVIDPEEERATANENIRQQTAQTAVDAMNGALAFNAGDVVEINTGDGNGNVQVTVAGAAIDKDSGLPVEGQVAVQLPDGQQAVFAKEQLQHMADAANLERLNNFEQERAATHAEQKAAEAERPQFLRGAKQPSRLALNDEFTILNDNGTPVHGSITSEKDDDGKVEIYTEEPINGNRVNRFTPAELEEMFDTYNGEPIATTVAVPENADNVPNPTESPEIDPEISENPTESVPKPEETATEPQQSAQAETTVPGTALSRVPVDEQGKRDFTGVDAETAWDALLESTDDEEMAQTYAEQMSAVSAKALEKAQKAKPSPIEDLEKFKEAERSRKAMIAAAQKRAEQWAKIAGVAKERRDREMEEMRRKAEEAEWRQKIEEKRQARLEREQKAQASREENASRPEQYRKAMAAWGEPTGVRGYIIRELLNPKVKLRWADQKDGGRNKGLGAHLFGGDAMKRDWQGEYGKRKWLVDDNNGIWPEALAERICEEFYHDFENGTDHFNEVFGELLDVLRSNPTTYALYQDALATHQSEAAYDMDDQEAQNRAWLEANGLTEEDMEVDREWREHTGMSEEEFDVFYSTFGDLIDATDEEYSEFIINFTGLIADEEYDRKQNQNAAESGGVEIYDGEGDQMVSGDGGAVEGAHRFGAERAGESGSDEVLLGNGTRNGGTGGSENGKESASNERGRQRDSQDSSGRQPDYLSQAKTEVTCELSSEINEFGKPFVKSSNGTIEFGFIDEESGLEPLPIRLSLGENYKDENGDNHGYGYLHIDAGHRAEILQNGFSSVEEFVESVAINYTEIKEGAKIGKNQTYLLEVSDEHNNTLFIQLSNDGKYWNVNSAGIFKKKYSRRKPKVYSRPAVGDGKDTVTVEVNSGQAKGATAPAGNSSETSDSKDTDFASDKQAVGGESSLGERVKVAEREVNTEPTEAQKEAGNYKKGHVQVGTFDVTIEQPVGSVRRGKDADGKEWETTMQNTYGYIRGTEGVDGDHIDVFLSTDIDAWDGRRVVIVDQYNPDGSFDEHKVMLGFNETEDAVNAYLSNYESGWENGRRLVYTSANLEDFEKWIESSHRKTKPYHEYRIADKGVIEESNRDVSGIEKLSEPEQKEVRDFLKDFRSAEIHIIRDETDVDQLNENDDVEEDLREGLRDREIGAGYHRVAKKIFIFATGDREVPLRETLIHENVHAVVHEAGEGVEEFLKAFSENVAPKRKLFRDLLAAIKEEYAAENVDNEFLAYILQSSMDKADRLAMIREALPDEVRDYLDNNIIAKLYGDRRETAREDRQGESGVGREAEREREEGMVSDRQPERQNHEDSGRGGLDGRGTEESGGEVTEERNVDARKSVGDEGAGNPEVYDAAKRLVESTGLKVHEVGDEEAQEIFGQKNTPVADQPNRANEKLTSGSVLAAHSGGSSSNATDSRKFDAKIINDTLSTKNKLKKYRNGDFQGDYSTVDKTLASLGALFSMRSKGGSRYTILQSDGGDAIAIRLSDHKANGNNFKRDNADRNLSIVLERRRFDTPESDIEFTEAVIPLSVFETHPEEVVRSIVTGVEDVLADKPFTLDSTIGTVDEVRKNTPLFHIRTYHGTGSNFDSFDFSYMGSGEGAQAFGWGGYVTEVKGIGKSYATAIGGKELLPKIEKALGNINQVKEWLRGHKDFVKYVREGKRHLNELRREYRAAQKEGNEKDMRFYEGLIEMQEQSLLPEKHAALIADKHNQLEEYQKELDGLNAELSQHRHLYTVRIPDDTGNNYLAWDGRADNVIERAGISEKEYEEYDMATGRDVYEYLSHKLGSTKAASKYLAERGFTGIKYTANHNNGGRRDGKNNYVIFKESDMQISNHVQFLKTQSGTVYGWTVGGEIYLNRDAMNPETPLHEYTHLWDMMVQRENPELWERGKELMKLTPMWDEVKADANYQDIAGDEDAIASEVHSRLTGRDGSKLLQEMINESRKEGAFKVAETVSLVDNLKRWLADMFKALKKTLDRWSERELENLSVEEFNRMVLRDLAEGLNPLTEQAHELLNEQLPDVSENEAEQGIETEYATEPISEINTSFNKQLELYISGQLPKQEVLQLGNPRGVMRKFLPDLPIVMRQRVIKKGSEKKHEVDVTSLIDMPQRLSTPIFVFQRDENTLGVLTDIKDRNGKNVCVAIELKRLFQNGNLFLEVNDVRSFHGREFNNIVGPIVNNGTLRWVDKEKGLAYLSSASQPVQQEIDGQVLESATKIVENFENPTIEEEESSEELYRKGDGNGGSDEAVSTAGDPVSKAMGRNRFSKKRQAEFAARERERMVARIEELASKLHIDKGQLEIVMDASQLEGKRATAKGFYNRHTKKITIVIPNNVSIIDAEQTLLHEAVAHYGLRQLFGDQFNTFLDNVYQSADESIRRKINEMAAKNGWNFRTATEEYLAGLAEDTEFESMNATWWRRIKQLFLDMLENIGFEGFRDKVGVVLTDNELRYILWRSYENLAEPGRYRSILGEAADIAKQSELKVGNYAEQGIETEYAAEPSDIAEINEVNNTFNEQLHQQINHTLPKGHIYQLGRPGKILRSTGIPDLPIQMSATRLKSKATEYGHDFDISEITNLVKELQDPVAVFAYGNKGKMQNIVVGIESNGKQFIVGLSLNPVVNGKALEINSIRNVFPKDNAEWLNWISQGKMLYADKEKIQALIDKQRTILADVDYLNLDDVTKIVENFENPTIEEEELFRPGDFTPRDKVMARDAYNRICASGSYQFKEAVQDSMLGLKELYKAISDGAKAPKQKQKSFRIEDVAGFENAYLFENRMSSINAGEQHEYFQRYMEPLLKEIGVIAGANERKRKDLTDYLMAKHGLERNEYMRNEAAANGEETDRDFAGLIGLTGEADWQSAEATARQWVEDYEKMVDTTTLWHAINDATKATLEKIYISGIISKETYEKILGMYQYYIPLRGWDETTSELVYGYLTSKDGPLGGSIIKKAEGRESMADDPIATISMMADDAIRQGNRNLMKQHFLNFILNHPSDAVSLNDLWLQFNSVSGEWEPVFADVEATDTADEVAQKVEAFEQHMEKLRNAEPDKYKKGHEAQHIPYKVKRKDLKEHQVFIKRNGRTFVATINGNPRAAQALNGLTNPDVDQNGAMGKILKSFEWVNRLQSAFYTALSPAFVATNYLRDMEYTNTSVWVKERPRYALHYHKNFFKFSPISPRRLIRWRHGFRGGTVYSTGMLLRKWEKGTLDMADQYEKLFYQFMKNGGETGYTSIRDIEKHKKTVAADLKRMSRRNIIHKSWHWLGEQMNILGRSVEDSARFAAFMTSREFGRSMDRAMTQRR